MSDRIFSPDSIQDGEVVIAIFGASEGDAFYEKYAEYLEMIQSDQVVSVYGFRPERKDGISLGRSLCRVRP